MSRKKRNYFTTKDLRPHSDAEHELLDIQPFQDRIFLYFLFRTATADVLHNDDAVKWKTNLLIAKNETFHEDLEKQQERERKKRRNVDRKKTDQ